MHTINRTLLGEIEQEITRAEQLHPEWPGDLLHAVAIVTEELGELVREILHYELEAKGNILELRKEAIETAAVAIRFLENL